LEDVYFSTLDLQGTKFFRMKGLSAVGGQGVRNFNLSRNPRQYPIKQ